MIKFLQVFQTFPTGSQRGRGLLQQEKLGPNLHLKPKPITMPSNKQIHEYKNTQIHRPKHMNTQKKKNWVNFAPKADYNAIMKTNTLIHKNTNTHIQIHKYTKEEKVGQICI